MQRHTQTRGFTLVELMMAIAVMSLIGIALTMFIRETYRGSFQSSNKLYLSQQVRQVTNEMHEFGQDATYGLLLKSFYSYPSGDNWRDPGSGKAAEEYALTSGRSGDFLVFVYYDIDDNLKDIVPPPIDRIIGYYRDVEPGSGVKIGPVRKFDIKVPAADEDKSVYELIPDVSAAEDHEMVLEFARGLANENLFYNFDGSAILVNAQIMFEDKQNHLDSLVTSTYNFTISPRGPRGNEDYPD